MKQIFLVIVALLLVSALVYGQKQPLPTMTGGVQGTRAAMLKGPHDFTPDSGAYTLEVLTLGNWDGTADSTVIHPHGAATGLCGYCHAPHVPPEGVAAPLWIRATEVTTYGPVYQNITSLDATVLDPGASDNYSAFCLGCHDGSQLFVSTAYAGGGRPYAGSASWTPYEGFTVRHEAEISPTGEYPLDHVHPVNFDYNAAQALDPQGIYPAGNATSYAWKGDNGSGQQTTVRLFDGYMQCSSCHNPHMNRGLGLAYSSSYGKLCVSCHKK
jgi:predicted CXXCH cytochrome family protein